MTSLEDVFDKGEAFMPFTVAGYPDKRISKKIIRSLIDSGADVIELGVPFSDPMADGPTIKEADMKALENGFSTGDVFEIASEFRETPIVVMAYGNTLHSYGYADFVEDAEQAGVDGLIVPDMPPEELEREMEDIDTDLDITFLISENSSPERVGKLGESTSGFAYLVSTRGTTGAREDFVEDARRMMKMTSDLEVPRAIGFGVSCQKHARQAIEAGADGVIVGSALIDAYEEGGLDRMKELASEIRKGVDG